MRNATDELRSAIGYDQSSRSSLQYGEDMIELINMQLAALGEPISGNREDYPFLQMGQTLMAHYQAKDRFRDELRPPIDQRIQDWLRAYLDDVDGGKPVRASWRCHKPIAQVYPELRVPPVPTTR